MNKSISLLFLVCCAALMSSCASGPTFNEMQASIPPLGQGNGRIYFYRTTVAGAAVQPAVNLNGQEVGTAKAKGFFYVDRAPGSYQVETSTEVKRRLSLTLENGQVRYVRFNIAMGFFVGHVYPELMDDATGAKDITRCSYTGTK